MATPQKLHEIAITLENEQRFHIAYKAAATSDGRSTSGSRRSAIRKFVDGKIIPTYLDTANVERLRRYFDDTMEMPKFVGENQYAYVTTVEFWKDEVRNPELKVASEPKPDSITQTKLKDLRAVPGFIETLRGTRELFRPTRVEKKLLELGWARESDAKHRWIAAELLKDQPVLPKHVPDCPIPIPSPEYEAQWCAEQAAQHYTHPNAPGRLYRKGADGFVEYAPVGGTWADCAKLTNNRLNEANGYIPVPAPTPQEPTMAKPIDITTKTLINGRDIKELSDSEVFQLIADEEARIAELEKIKAQPKKLVAEIEKRKAGIAALVAHLDAAV